MHQSHTAAHFRRRTGTAPVDDLKSFWGRAGLLVFRVLSAIPGDTIELMIETVSV